MTRSPPTTALLKVMGKDNLKVIATELVTRVRKSVTIDWTLRESARAKIKVLVKRILRKHGYPPDLQDEATKLVLHKPNFSAQNGQREPHRRCSSMSAQPLLSPETAARSSFADIARNLRENIEEARLNRLPPGNEELFHKLLNLLEDKIFEAPAGRPPRPKLPPAPREPRKPRLPDLPIPDSDEYRNCRDRYRQAAVALEREVKTGSKKERRDAGGRLRRLHAEMESKLADIALKGQPTSFREAWWRIANERALFPKRLREYNRDLDDYNRRTASLRRARGIWDARYGPSGEDRKIGERIVEHLRSDIEADCTGRCLIWCTQAAVALFASRR